MQAFTVIYELLGGLGVFFLGMKMMSDALQQAAGETIKRIINSLTSNRIFAVLVGLVVTMILQSSSITTVMVVGLVNAGLMELIQAIGIVFGANIGTTITGWIISIKVGKYGLLLIGLGIFPMLFGKKDITKNIGRAILGVGMIFFGLEIMSNAFAPLRNMPAFLNAISYFNEQSYPSYLASIFIGCFLTTIVQSSSAMLGITIAMAGSGVLTFHTSMALVLGQNIGTTITALLAAVGGNVSAKRTARAHTIFNIVGVVIVFSLFPFYINLIEWLIPGMADLVNSTGEKPNIAVHIATGHTIFNVGATILFIPFINQLANFVTFITPDKKNKEHHHLVMLGNPTEMVPATALVQAQQELKRMNEVVYEMFTITREYLAGTHNNTTHLAKIKDFEQITDNMQKEITLFICQVMEKQLSTKQSHEAQAIVRIADELESIADYLEKLAIQDDKFIKEAKLNPESRDEFFAYYDKLLRFYNAILRGVTSPSEIDFTIVERKNNELFQTGDFLREKYIADVAKGEYNALSAMTFSDMIMSMKKIRAHSNNISDAIKRHLLESHGF